MDKVSIHSSAILNPQLISDIANEFGSQCVVLAIDTKLIDNRWIVFRNGGKIQTEITAFDWATKGVSLGAGEILLTSMNNDGAKAGFALDITRQISEKVSVPVIASGGAGKMQDFADVFNETKATGALAASVFHYHQIRIPNLKQFLNNQKIQIRL